jgi:hypothetical protein
MSDILTLGTGPHLPPHTQFFIPKVKPSLAPWVSEKPISSLCYHLAFI